MPNWCYNRLTLMNNQEIVDRIANWVDHQSNPSGLFSLFYPLPEELSDTEYYLYRNSVPEKKEAERLQALKEKYGYDNWYEWALNNWGCKWDTRELTLEEQHEDTIHLCFDTPWCPPIDFYNKLSKDYSVNIEASYTEEGNDFAGYYLFDMKKGKTIENIDPIEEIQSVLDEYQSLNLPETNWLTFEEKCEDLWNQRDISRYISWFSIFNCHNPLDFDEDQLKKYKIVENY